MTEQDIVERLKSSPLYAMSLGSKELYHTNVWAWLIRKDHHFVQIFCKEDFVSKFQSVEREQDNRDLTIWFTDGSACVVENKVKSLPYEEQLQDYRADFLKKFGDKLVSSILVSTTDPSFLSSLSDDQWSYLPFAEVITRIRNLLPSSSLSDFDKSIVNAYCDDAMNVSALLNEFKKTVGERMPTWSDLEVVEQVRFGDVCEKMKAEELSRRLVNEPWFMDLAAKAKEKGYKLTSWSGFSDKKWIVDARFIYDLTPGTKITNDIVLGVQMQMDQFRYVAQRCGNDDSLPDRIFTEFKELGWFTDYDKHTKNFLGRHTSMNKQYCQYHGKADYPYYFIYQYNDIDDLSFEALTSRIKEALTKAYDLLDVIKK